MMAESYNLQSSGRGYNAAWSWDIHIYQRAPPAGKYSLEGINDLNIEEKLGNVKYVEDCLSRHHILLAPTSKDM